MTTNINALKVRISNKSRHINPQYGTAFSAGMDLCANIDEDIIIKPLKRVLVKTGLFIEIPDGFEGQVRPRSGLAYKNGITVLNAPGTIDSDYRGEVGVILINLSDTDFTIKDGDRIAQLVINKHESIQWIDVDFVNETKRGSGGFGHTGV